MKPKSPDAQEGNIFNVMFLIKKKLAQKVTNDGKVLTLDQLKKTIAFSYTRLSTGNVDKPSDVIERNRKRPPKPVEAALAMRRREYGNGSLPC